MTYIDKYTENASLQIPEPKQYPEPETIEMSILPIMIWYRWK
jgi:hypothetical protein